MPSKNLIYIFKKPTQNNKKHSKGNLAMYFKMYLYQVEFMVGTQECLNRKFLL